MADWTLSTATTFRPYRTPKGTAQLKYYQESTCASTHVIKRGQVVTADTVVAYGDRIVMGPSSGGNGSNLLQVGITSLMGIAAEDSTSDGSTTGLSATMTNRKIGVYVADGKTEYLGWLKGSGPAASSLIGTDKAIIRDTTLNVHFIDSTNSTAALAAVRITDVPDWAVGDTNGPVIFKFLSSNVSPSV